MNFFKKLVDEFTFKCELCEKRKVVFSYVSYIKHCKQCDDESTNFLSSPSITIRLCRKCIGLPFSFTILIVTHDMIITKENLEKWSNIFERVHNRKEHLSVNLV